MKREEKNVKRKETNMKWKSERKIERATLHERPFTLHASRSVTRASRFTLHASCLSQGFTLLEVIGVLAVMSILMAILLPNVIDQLDRAAREAERSSLQSIAQGVEAYLRENKQWPPNLSALSPDYVPFGTTQLTINARGFPRYFVVHPDVSGFSNATGLSPSSLPDARFLLISNIRSDAAPTINNANQFNNWWDTDETSTPDLKIHRGHVSNLFHLLSISAVGDGGSYRIDGVNTNSGGNRLASRGNYHLAGTVVEVAESNNFSSGNYEFGFTLVADAGYQFDPNCAAGSQWHVLGASC